VKPTEPSLRQRAVRLLARREHSAVELARKLAAHGTEDEIATVISELQHRHLQSDARVADALLRAKGARLGLGGLRQTLRQKGVAREVIDAQLAEADLGSEVDRARALWQQKFGTAPGDAREWARQARFLQSRGFASDVIRKLLREPEAEE
jgi:regulatory protein